MTTSLIRTSTVAVYKLEKDNSIRVEVYIVNGTCERVTITNGTSNIHCYSPAILKELTETLKEISAALDVLIVKPDIKTLQEAIEQAPSAGRLVDLK